MTTTNDLAERSPLGKSSAYRSDYAPELLFPIPRQGKRDELELHGTLPFFGLDIWNAYELSWLNQRGKPQVAIAKVSAPADSPNIIESKSFKLYLNSFNQTKLDSPEALLTLLKQDLSNGFGAPVQVELTLQEDFGKLKMGEFDGVLLDRLDLEITQYTPSPLLLKAAFDDAPVEEKLVSHLLKSNCLVTGQPDWGSVQIAYAGPQIDQESLLRYLIGFANTMNSTSNAWSAFLSISCASASRKNCPCMRAIHAAADSISIRGRSNYSTGAMPGNLRNARQ